MFTSIANMARSFSTIVKEACQDNVTGKYSHSRIIAMLVAFGATAFMWKLVLMGGMSIEYFLAYLAYGTGYQGMNKLLDNKDVARIEQGKAINKVDVMEATAKIENDDVLPKPPKD